MNKNNIIKRAKNTLNTELKELKGLSKIFNNNFYKAVILLSKIKGRVIVTGVGKSAHIGNKISATLASTGTPSYLIHATEASHGDLGGITKNDCILAISNSGETSELKNKLDIMLVRENRIKIANACFEFLGHRTDLDLFGWHDVDIFKH